MNEVGLAISFDDVMLVPRYSRVESRKSVVLKMPFDKKVPLLLPVIAAPMDTVCEVDMAKAMAEAGGFGVLHRFANIDDRVRWVLATLLRFPYSLVAAAVGATDNYLREASLLIKAGAKVILVDVAHGHHSNAGNAVYRIKSAHPEVHVMAGNVATEEGFRFLQEAGADSIRVGVGGGSCCTTRVITGHGIPTLDSVRRISLMPDRTAKIVADGGIRNTGDMVKAFAFGADAVMVGSMLAGTTEAPGEIIDGSKVFRGMASEEAQKNWRGFSSTPEGISTTVALKGPVQEILDDIKGGLRSGCSYSGVSRLSDLYEFSEYVKITQGGIRESVPHAKVKI